MKGPALASAGGADELGATASPPLPTSSGGLAPAGAHESAPAGAHESAPATAGQRLRLVGLLAEGDRDGQLRTGLPAQFPDTSGLAQVFLDGAE